MVLNLLIIYGVGFKMVECVLFNNGLDRVEVCPKCNHWIEEKQGVINCPCCGYSDCLRCGE